MNERCPRIEDVRPDWQAVRAELQSAERDVARLPRGSEERRIASKRASFLAREWRRILDDAWRAKREAGWCRTMDGAWTQRVSHE